MTRPAAARRGAEVTGTLEHPPRLVPRHRVHNEESPHQHRVSALASPAPAPPHAAMHAAAGERRHRRHGAAGAPSAIGLWRRGRSPPDCGGELSYLGTVARTVVVSLAGC